ncbi:hypothetical protein [Actinopolyspora mortivallis]|uniref:hypothetical protein n=1 Tax=Actinopolyspora mortivallis TaxID=33906 RepID=UPI000374E8C9|nr:hypothetical protein [Actinopolyspora mortivallis]
MTKATEVRRQYSREKERPWREWGRAAIRVAPELFPHCGDLSLRPCEEHNA